MVRSIKRDGVIPQGFCCLSPFPFFIIFEAFSCRFSWWNFGGVSLGDSCWMSHMRTLCLFAWWLYSSNPPKNGFDLLVFCGVFGKTFLRVNFLFPLIESVLGTELLAKGSPWGTLAIPKVSLESVEWYGRLVDGKVEFFPQAESSRLSRPNRPDRFHNLVWLVWP
jgi:hypothetical protein